MRGKRGLIFKSDKGIVRSGTEKFKKNIVRNQLSGNKEKSIDTQGTDLDQCNDSSVKKAKTRKEKGISNNQEPSLEKKRDCCEHQYQQEDEVKALKDLKEQLSKRHELEQYITKLVGGNTGMVQLLDHMITQAKNENKNSFIFYATSFQKKAEKLKDYLIQYYDYKPEDNVLFEYSVLKKEKEELERLLTQPAQNEKLYVKLLQVNQVLREYISMDGNSISKDDLRNWRNAVLLLESGQS